MGFVNSDKIWPEMRVPFKAGGEHYIEKRRCCIKKGRNKKEAKRITT